MTQATTFNLAKALYHVKNAVHYFEHIKSQPEVKYDAKHFFNLQLTRLNGIISDMTAKLTPEAAQVLRNELESDTMVFEAIQDKLVNLKETDRWRVENYIDDLLKWHNTQTTSPKTQ